MNVKNPLKFKDLRNVDLSTIAESSKILKYQG